MRKHHIGDLHLIAQIIRLLVLQLRQPGQQIRPEEIRIGLHEDVPFRVGARLQRLLDHGQELPLIQFPAWVVRFPEGGVGIRVQVGGCEGCAPGGADAVVDAEIRVGLFDVLGYVFEDVVELHVVDFLGVVGEDYVVWDAAEGGLQVDGDFVAGFGDAGFQDHEDVLQAGEVGTVCVGIVLSLRECDRGRGVLVIHVYEQDDQET